MAFCLCGVKKGLRVRAARTGRGHSGKTWPKAAILLRSEAKTSKDIQD